MSSKLANLLGLSIGKLIRISDTEEFSKALDTLMNEFDVQAADTQSKRKHIIHQVIKDVDVAAKGLLREQLQSLSFGE
eukprot:jgi/Hompol1/398/HPOL_002509-RA